MNKFRPATKFRKLAATLTAVATFVAYSTALAVPTPPAVFPVCFGSLGLIASAGPFVDINGSPGLETLVPHRSVTIDLDDDFDLLAVAHVNYILNYHDETGALVWQRAGLAVSSNEVFTALAGLDLLSVGTTFTPPLQMASFYTLGFTCEGTGIAEVGSNQYVIMTAGASAAEGDVTTGTDLSKIRIWVLDKTDGSDVKIHTVAGVPGTFLVAQSSGIFDIDADGDDELVIVRAEPRANLGDKERVFIHTETINLLTGVSEGTTTVNYSISMNNMNNP
jgi:hypothetical protein